MLPRSEGYGGSPGGRALHGPAYPVRAIPASDEIMTSLSRLVVTGLEGPRLDARTRRRLERLAPGGVILFKRNVGDPGDLREMTRDLRRILGPKAIISLDQEGGRVQRLRAPFGEWPPMRRIGATCDASLARAVGQAIGRDVAAAGFDCDFAPVLDVDSNPANPVIGDRSFHSDPRTVARLSLAFAGGLYDAGVIACGKHFPGHGDTEVDSHLALPVVRREARELARLELAPFRAAIRARLPMLMTAHVVYTALDPERPATLSPAILHDLLRKRLRFEGVVVSDDLAMHALDAFGSPAELGVAAVRAGCDLLLACRSLDDAEVIASGLDDALRSGRIEPRRAADSLRRLAVLHRTGRRPGVRRPDLQAFLGRREYEPLLARLAALEARRAASNGPARPGRRPDRTAARRTGSARRAVDPTTFRA